MNVDEAMGSKRMGISQETERTAHGFGSRKCSIYSLTRGGPGFKGVYASWATDTECLNGENLAEGELECGQ